MPKVAIVKNIHSSGIQLLKNNSKFEFEIIEDYSKENLIGKQVIGVCNFPTKNIAGVVSEVLILGAIEKDGKVVLIHPSQKTENGLDIA